jgi:hypothetical protein
MDGVNPVGVIEDPLGQGGLAGIDMGTDADISHLVNFLFHFTFLLRQSLICFEADLFCRRLSRRGRPRRQTTPDRCPAGSATCQ